MRNERRDEEGDTLSLTHTRATSRHEAACVKRPGFDFDGFCIATAGHYRIIRRREWMVLAWPDAGMREGEVVEGSS